MRVSIDSGKCQGHGRCYDLAPDLFGEDEEGFGDGAAGESDDDEEEKKQAVNVNDI